MGDLLESPRVAPLVSLFSIIFLPLFLSFYASVRGRLFPGCTRWPSSGPGWAHFRAQNPSFWPRGTPFPSVLYTESVFKEFGAHSFAFNRCIVCFILLGGTWTNLSTRSHHYEGCAFPSVLYTETVFKEFSAHSIAFNRCTVCFILLGGTWTCLSTGSHHNASYVRQVRFISFLRKSTNGSDHSSTNAPDHIRTPPLGMLGRE